MKKYNPEDPRLAPTRSLSRTASWVIREKSTGRVIMETFSQKVVKALNTKKYEAVPILEYLQSFNAKNNPGDPRLAPTVRIRAQIKMPQDTDARHRTTRRMPAVRVGVSKSNPCCLTMTKATWKRLHHSDKRHSSGKRYVRCASTHAPGKTRWLMVQLPK